ncbi:MAG: DUF3151 family protein [Actinomycetota bacterium]|nr:DUF3151 family protein [Actinomycetota bacterium]
MSEHPVPLSPHGPPHTVLPDEPAEVRHALAQQHSAEPAQRRGLAAQVVAAHPRSLAAWCALGDAATDPVERYAAYRIGYHRGLDTLRANGWRGSGYVRWADETNRGFLGCLRGLQAMAAEIGETDEVERIGLFLLQLDPSGGHD